jgi:uncharacterized membrane protein
MELLSMKTAVIWALALVGFVALFLGITIISMKLTKPKR